MPGILHRPSDKTAVRHDARIPAGELDRIFERFARGAQCTGRPGTGLGLPIVRAIAAAHGGAATVESRHGAGATFTVTLGAALPTGAALYASAALPS